MYSSNFLNVSKGDHEINEDDHCEINEDEDDLLVEDHHNCLELFTVIILKMGYLKVCLI